MKQSVWWTRYFTIRPGVLVEHVPKRAPVTWLTDVVPSNGYMRSWIRRHSGGATAAVLDLNFAQRWFWDDLITDFSQRRQGMDMDVEAADATYSDYVHERAQEVVADLFDSAAIRSCAESVQSCAGACLHLRLGDRTNDYPPGCTSVQTVELNVASNFAVRQFPRGAPTHILVMTNEKRQSYLDALRTELNKTFDTVRFEADFDWQQQQALATDNFLRFLVLGAACESISPWNAMVEFHPHNLCSNDNGRARHLAYSVGAPAWILPRERRLGQVFKARSSSPFLARPSHPALERV